MFITILVISFYLRCPWFVSNIFISDPAITCYLEKMKRGSCFINAGRGDQVDEEDLLENSKSGHITSAILDVYKNEPN